MTACAGTLKSAPEAPGWPVSTRMNRTPPRINPTKINGMRNTRMSQAGSRRRIRSSFLTILRLRRIVLAFRFADATTGQIAEDTLKTGAEDADTVQLIDLGIELVENLSGDWCWIGGGKA